MTRMLFLADNQTYAIIDSPDAAAELIEAVRCGRWSPPPPWQVPANLSLRALEIGGTVVVAPMPAENAPGGSLWLTGSQQQVLQLLAEGFSIKQAANRMGISRRTVYVHLSAVHKRLGTTSCAQAVARAISLGLLHLDH